MTSKPELHEGTIENGVNCNDGDCWCWKKPEQRPSKKLLDRLRLAEAEHCRQRSLESSLLGEAADEIERLRSLHDAYVMAAAKHAQELERQRDDARIVSDRWAAEAQRLRAAEPPTDDREEIDRLRHYLRRAREVALTNGDRHAADLCSAALLPTLTKEAGHE